MRKLDRTEAPTCLRAYTHRSHKWEDLSPDHKRDIWEVLDGMQLELCAYCERDIPKGSPDRHIEHFLSQQRNQTSRFAWSNLFGSCNSSRHCGNYKDSSKGKPYQPSDLLKPDVDDPYEHLLFLRDGTVSPREDLEGLERKRASETLRVLNLNALRQRRAAVVYMHQATLNEILSVADEFELDDLKSIINEELAALAGVPCAAAVRQIYLGILGY